MITLERQEIIRNKVYEYEIIGRENENILSKKFITATNEMK